MDEVTQREAVACLASCNAAIDHYGPIYIIDSVPTQYGGMHMHYLVSVVIPRLYRGMHYLVGVVLVEGVGPGKRG